MIYYHKINETMIRIHTNFGKNPIRLLGEKSKTSSTGNFATKSSSSLQNCTINNVYLHFKVTTQNNSRENGGNVSHTKINQLNGF
jgi:hypothetical protein